VEPAALIFWSSEYIYLEFSFEHSLGSIACRLTHYLAGRLSHLQADSLPSWPSFPPAGWLTTQLAVFPTCRLAHYQAGFFSYLQAGSLPSWLSFPPAGWLTTKLAVFPTCRLAHYQAGCLSHLQLACCPWRSPSYFNLKWFHSYYFYRMYVYPNRNLYLCIKFNFHQNFWDGCSLGAIMDEPQLK
jgi:hypothetical protein